MGSIKGFFLNGRDPQKDSLAVLTDRSWQMGCSQAYAKSQCFGVENRAEHSILLTVVKMLSGSRMLG